MEIVNREERRDERPIWSSACSCCRSMNWEISTQGICIPWVILSSSPSSRHLPIKIQYDFFMWETCVEIFTTKKYSSDINHYAILWSGKLWQCLGTCSQVVMAHLARFKMVLLSIMVGLQGFVISWFKRYDYHKTRQVRYHSSFLNLQKQTVHNDLYLSLSSIYYKDRRCHQFIDWRCLKRLTNPLLLKCIELIQIIPAFNASMCCWSYTRIETGNNRKWQFR